MLLTVALLGCKSEPASPTPPIEAPSLTEVLASLAGDVPGLAAAIVDTQGVVHAGVTGIRRADRANSTIGADEPWHLGSNTKSMTAALFVTVSEEDGGIDLDTTLGEIWPDAHADHQATTFRELLDHTGGLTGNLPGDHLDIWDELTDPDPAAGRAEAAAQLLARPADATRGSFTYSNAGFIVAGAALQAHTGESWESLMQTRLFTPLGMDCGFGPPPAPAPWGHVTQNGTRTAVDPAFFNADNPAGLGPAGTVHCPLDAWGLYAAWILRGARGEDDRLSPAGWEALLPAVGEGYGGGWGILGDGTLSHDGSNTLWYARINLDPQAGTGELIVTNAGDQAAIDTVGAVDDRLDGFGDL